MAPRGWSIAIGMWLVAAPVAEADPAAQGAAETATEAAIARLEHALPAGWSLLATGSELVIRHDRPCYVTGARPGAGGPAAATGPVVTIELRYRLEPRWTAQQLTAARAANDQIDGELRTLAARYRIDAIRTSQGQRGPASADEQARRERSEKGGGDPERSAGGAGGRAPRGIDAYEAERARLAARRVQLPRCTLGDASVFDGEDTYAQLALQVDPPEVMTQAHHIVELVKQHCR